VVDNQDQMVQEKMQFALSQFLQTETFEEAQQVLEENPELLSDQIDLLLSSLIHDARQQGQGSTADALDERRHFIREVREIREGPQDTCQNPN